MKDQFEGNCQSISYQFITKLVREDWLSLQGVAEPSSEHAEQTSPRTHPVSVEITRQYQFIHHFPSLTKPLIKACFQDIPFRKQKKHCPMIGHFCFSSVCSESVRTLSPVTGSHCFWWLSFSISMTLQFKGFFLQWMKQPIPNSFYTFYIHVQVESLEEKAILVNSWMFI